MGLGHHLQSLKKVFRRAKSEKKNSQIICPNKKLQ